MRKCIYDYAYGPLKYPLGFLFLIDFHLTWKQNEKRLRGDTATNLSSGLARYLGLVGSLLSSIQKRVRIIWEQH